MIALHFCPSPAVPPLNSSREAFQPPQVGLNHKPSMMAVKSEAGQLPADTMHHDGQQHKTSWEWGWAFTRVCRHPVPTSGARDDLRHSLGRTDVLTPAGGQCGLDSEMSRHIGGRELLGPDLERIQTLQGFSGGEQLYLHKTERQNKTKHKTSKRRRIYREGGRLGIWAGNRFNLRGGTTGFRVGRWGSGPDSASGSIW